MALTLPPTEVVDAIHGTTTRVTRRVAFYMPDGVTPWEPEGPGVRPPLIDGSVSLDQSREERRQLSLTISGEGGTYRPGVEALWYDKVVKVWRGVEYPGGSWERQLGEFYIDRLDWDHHPDTVRITARDGAKLMKKSKFASNTRFPINHPIEDVVRDIAVSGGLAISKINVPITNAALNEDTYFDQGAERWGAMAEVATAFGYELFFDNEGNLTMREFQDPFLLAAEYTFQTGSDGNLVQFSRSINDSRLRNHVVVHGEAANKTPIYAELLNHSSISPTNIARIGKRTEVFRSGFVQTVDQAAALCEQLMKVMGLEQYDVDLSAIVIPYIDVGVVARFLDPDTTGSEPTEYLIQRVDIPLGPGPMRASVGRVTNLDQSAAPPTYEYGGYQSPYGQE